jgi:hypothetical protein
MIVYSALYVNKHSYKIIAVSDPYIILFLGISLYLIYFVYDRRFILRNLGFLLVNYVDTLKICKLFQKENMNTNTVGHIPHVNMFF